MSPISFCRLNIENQLAAQTIKMCMQQSPSACESITEKLNAIDKMPVDVYITGKSYPSAHFRATEDRSLDMFTKSPPGVCLTAETGDGEYLSEVDIKDTDYFYDKPESKIIQPKFESFTNGILNFFKKE